MIDNILALLILINGLQLEEIEANGLKKYVCDKIIK